MDRRYSKPAIPEFNLRHPDGVLPPYIMPDKLHPAEKGCEIRAEAVKKPPAELMK